MTFIFGFTMFWLAIIVGLAFIGTMFSVEDKHPMLAAILAFVLATTSGTMIAFGFEASARSGPICECVALPAEVGK